MHKLIVPKAAQLESQQHVRQDMSAELTVLTSKLLKLESNFAADMFCYIEPSDD